MGRNQIKTIFEDVKDMIVVYQLTQNEALIYGLGSMVMGSVLTVIAVYLTPILAPYIIKAIKG